MRMVERSGDSRVRVAAGTYRLYGRCDQLPNVGERHSFGNGQRLKCVLTLTDAKDQVAGHVKLVKGGQGGYYRFGANEEEEEEADEVDVFAVDAAASQWDAHGGVHVRLENGYVMDGFLNGADYMGTFKDERLRRFGAFQFEVFASARQDAQQEVQVDEPVGCLVRAVSLDSDDEVLDIE